MADTFANIGESGNANAMYHPPTGADHDERPLYDDHRRRPDLIRSTGAGRDSNRPRIELLSCRYAHGLVMGAAGARQRRLACPIFPE